jgi:hypothetical protein
MDVVAFGEIALRVKRERRSKMAARRKKTRRTRRRAGKTTTRKKKERSPLFHLNLRVLLGHLVVLPQGIWISELFPTGDGDPTTTIPILGSGRENDQGNAVVQVSPE